VLFLWEPRSYHCQVACRPDALLDRWLHQTQHFERDAAAIAAAWQAAGHTHLLLNQSGLDFVVADQFDPVTSADLTELETLQEEHLRLVRSWGDAYYLYAWK
jgi:hypothetical protein